MFVYEMNSVQHSSATYATHFSETWLIVLCNTIMKHVKHGYETSVTFRVFLIVSVHTMLDFGVTNVWWLIILLSNLVTPRMSLETMFMWIILPN